MHRSFLLLALAVGLALPTSAQGVPAQAVTAALIKDCRPTSRPAPNRFVVDAAGRVLQAPTNRIYEGRDISVYLLAPSKLRPLFDVKRTSGTRDIDAVRVIGIANQSSDPNKDNDPSTIAPIFSDPGPCESTEFVLGDFAPGEGSFAVRFVATDEPKELSEVSFAVGRTYRAAASFGAYYSLLDDDVVGTLADPNAEADGDSLLTLTPGSGSIQSGLAFTYFLDGDQPRHIGARPGLFLAFPFTNLGRSVLGGVSLDLGSGLFIAHAGYHIGLVDRIVGDAEDGDVLPERFEAATLAPTKEVVRGQPVFGISVDAITAAEAFGNIFSGLADGGG